MSVARHFFPRERVTDEMDETDKRVVSPAARAKFAWLVTAAQGVVGGAGVYVGCGPN